MTGVLDADPGLSLILRNGPKERVPKDAVTLSYGNATDLMSSLSPNAQ
jgi:hypothetical protein